MSSTFAAIGKQGQGIPTVRPTAPKRPIRPGCTAFSIRWTGSGEIVTGAIPYSPPGQAGGAREKDNRACPSFRRTCEMRGSTLNVGEKSAMSRQVRRFSQADSHARLIVFALFSEVANRTGRDSKPRPRLDFLSPSSAGSSLHPRSRGVEGTAPLSDPACFSMASRRVFSHSPTAAHGSSPPPWEARLKPAGAKPLGSPSPRLKAGCKEESAEDGPNVPGFGSVKPARLGFASLEESTPPLRKTIKRLWLTAYATLLSQANCPNLCSCKAEHIHPNGAQWKTVFSP